MEDPYDLQRFLSAQADTYQQALREIRAGHKSSHWMWFVFPQLRGLGASATAHRFGISGAAEARAYLAHPTLGPRLVEGAQAILDLSDSSAHDIFGSSDDMKLKSCATLFVLRRRMRPADAGDARQGPLSTGMCQPALRWAWSRS